jgi:hypothetical protein
MNMKKRLTKVEKTVGGRSACPDCHDDHVAPVCLYEQDANGRCIRVSGTPQPHCPTCGRAASQDRIAAVIIRSIGSRCPIHNAAALKKCLLNIESNSADPEIPTAENQPPRSNEEVMHILRTTMREFAIPDPFPDWTDARRYLAVTRELLTPLLALSGPNRWIMPPEELATPTAPWQRFWSHVTPEAVEELFRTAKDHGGLRL